MTALPIYLADGRYLLHLGLGGTVRDPDADQYRTRARTSIRNGPAALHTLLLDARMFATGQSMLVPELAIVAGPFGLQAEYIANWVQDATTPFPAQLGVTPTNHGTVFFHGYYVEALWFLTGEHRPYNKKAGAFGRVIPLENFFLVGCDGTPLFGKGAWQIGVRYSYLDLDNRGLEAGTLHDWTIGLNWFLNPNMKFQWNYARCYRDVAGADSDGFIDAFGMRLAWDY
jgi:phosphate-selective porin OprO/OprP